MPETPEGFQRIGQAACPLCGRASAFRAHGVVAPFITELARRDDRQATCYMECRDCDLTFYSYRYNEQEMDALYRDYRSGDYARVRHRWEPWYTHRVNDAYVDNTDAVDSRRAFMDHVLSKATLPSPLRCVVDFGGDEGQFFPSLAADRRIVLDPSDRSLRPGVERIPTLQDMSEVDPDLVIVAHVLEHLPSPLQVLRDIHAAMPPDSTLYVEVPLDRPRVRRAHASARYGRWLSTLSRRRATFIPADFITGACRQFGRAAPRFGALKQSEHINYFSVRSMSRLLDLAGFAPSAHVADPTASMGGLRLGRLGVVATRTGRTTPLDRGASS